MSEVAPRQRLGFLDAAFYAIAVGIGMRWIAVAAAVGPGSLLLWLLAGAGDGGAEPGRRIGRRRLRSAGGDEHSHRRHSLRFHVCVAKCSRMVRVPRAWAPPGGQRTSLVLAWLGAMSTLVAIACSLAPNTGDPHPLLGLAKIVLSTLAMFGVGLFLYWIATRRRVMLLDRRDFTRLAAKGEHMSDTSRKLGPFLAMMVVANTTIGSGIYLLPASLGAVGSISIIAWILATAGAALICGVFAFLAILNPGTSGLFSYIRDGFGPLTAFVTAFIYWVSCLVAAVAIALAVTGYFAVFVPWAAKPPGLPLATIAALWIFLGANAIGPRFVARLQSWSMPLGLAPVLLAATVGWFWFHGATFSASWNVSGQSDLSILPRATVMVFWAFLGIECAIILSVRVRNPGRDVPIGTLGGLAIAAIIYIAASAAIMGILPAAALLKSTAPFADAAAPAIGAAAAGAVALCALLKACSTLSGTWLVTAESAESESLAGQMRIAPPAAVSHKVSIRTLAFNGIVATLIVMASVSPTLARQFTIVTNVAVVLSLVVYAAAALALFRLSRSLSAAPRLWARILAVAATLFSGALIVASEPDLLVWSAGTVVLAVALHALFRARKTRQLKLQRA